MSKHKYASNVIEKCFVHATTPRERMDLIDQILGRDTTTTTMANGTTGAQQAADGHSSAPQPAHLVSLLPSSSSPFLSLVKDQFGNFVVQSVLDNATAEERALIIARIRRYAAHLRKIPYGKHIIARIEKLSGQPFHSAAAAERTDDDTNTSPGKPQQPQQQQPRR